MIGICLVVFYFGALRAGVVEAVEDGGDRLGIRLDWELPLVWVEGWEVRPTWRYDEKLWPK
jgi:hypothetical protein